MPNLRLHKNCIFVRLDGMSVVFDHAQRRHFTPQNDSARIVLDLLARKADKDHGNRGTNKQDIVNQLVETFAVNQQQAEAALDGFLNELRGFGLLDENLPNSDHVPPDNQHYPHQPHGEARGHITAGGTVVMVGYLITWYWG